MDEPHTIAGIEITIDKWQTNLFEMSPDGHHSDGQVTYSAQNFLMDNEGAVEICEYILSMLKRELTKPCANCGKAVTAPSQKEMKVLCEDCIDEWTGTVDQESPRVRDNMSRRSADKPSRDFLKYNVLHLVVLFLAKTKFRYAQGHCISREVAISEENVRKIVQRNKCSDPRQVLEQLHAYLGELLGVNTGGSR
ncbi:MAG: hypothetical protein ACFFD4_02490 [Candidatus Odinarchaeota archaeon]